MKELKDYIKYQKFSGMSDIEVITAYFVDNDIEEEAMELSHNLAKSKIEKLRTRSDIIKTWAYSIPSEYLYEKYELKTAAMLHKIELEYIINGEVTGKGLTWAKENIPKLQQPAVYFQPCQRWLEEQGIWFATV